MIIILTIFDVSIKEKRVYGNPLCFEVTSLANELEKKEQHGPVPACK